MDNIQSTTTWGTASQSLNTNFTSIQSALDAINTSLGNKAASTTVSDLATQLSALQQVVTSTATDPDSVINTIQEVLQAFAQFPEGTTVATALSGKVDKTLTINGNPLSANVVLTPADIGVDTSQFIAATRKINGKALSADITLVPSDFTLDSSLTSTGSNFIKSGDIFNSLLTGGAVPPNLVTSVLTNTIWSNTGVLTATSGYKAVSNIIPATPVSTFAIQGLTRTNVTATYVGRLFNSSGGYIGDIPKANLTTISGGYLITVPNTVGVAGIGLFFDDTTLPAGSALIVQAGSAVVTGVPNVALKTTLLPNNGITAFKQSDLSNDQEHISVADLAAITSMASGQLTYFNKGASVKNLTPTKALSFLLLGQSQADGRIPVASLPAYWTGSNANAIINNSDTLNWHPYNTTDFVSNQFSYELMLYNLILTYQHSISGHATDNIYITKKTLGGTGIDATNGDGATGRWTADYETLGTGVEKLLLTSENRYRNAAFSQTASLYDTRFVIWDQGEGDRNASANYYNNLKNLIYYVRGFVGKPTLPFILIGVPSISTQYNATVDQAKQQLASETPTTIFYIAGTTNASYLQADSIHVNYAGGLDRATSIYNLLLTNKPLFGLYQ